MSYPSTYDAKFTARQAGLRKRVSSAVLKLEREAAEHGGCTDGLNKDGPSRTCAS